MDVVKTTIQNTVGGPPTTVDDNNDECDNDSNCSSEGSLSFQKGGQYPYVINPKNTLELSQTITIKKRFIRKTNLYTKNVHTTPLSVIAEDEPFEPDRKKESNIHSAAKSDIKIKKDECSNIYSIIAAISASATITRNKDDVSVSSGASTTATPATIFLDSDGDSTVYNGTNNKNLPQGSLNNKKQLQNGTSHQVGTMYDSECGQYRHDMGVSWEDFLRQSNTDEEDDNDTIARIKKEFSSLSLQPQRHIDEILRDDSKNENIIEISNTNFEKDLSRRYGNDIRFLSV